jgi:hypothetical protein
VLQGVAAYGDLVPPVRAIFLIHAQTVMRATDYAYWLSCCERSAHLPKIGRRRRCTRSAL